MWGEGGTKNNAWFETKGHLFGSYVPTLSHAHPTVNSGWVGREILQPPNKEGSEISLSVFIPSPNLSQVTVQEVLEDITVESSPTK